MIVYQTDYTGDGRFVGVLEADLDPMEEGKFLIPAGAVTLAPPVAEAPAYARWAGDAWEVYLPPEPEPEPEMPPQEPKLAPLTRRQLRLGLLTNGITTAAVEAAIAAIPDPMDRAVAEIEWADASTYERDHHLIEMVGGVLGLTHEQIDTMWGEALSL